MFSCWPRRVTAILVFTLFLILGPKLALADPVNFTFSGVADGSIGGNTFSSSFFEIMIDGDTNNVQPVPGFPNSIRILSGSASINIAGATSTINTQLSVFANNGGFVGLALPPSTDLILGPGDGVFASYDLTTSIGPITNIANFEDWGSVNIDTSGGQLIFDDGPVLTTFTATVTAVPEPGTAILGLGGLVILRRKRRAKSID